MNDEFEDIKPGIYFECTICTLDYGLVVERVPRALHCGHTFCHSCLKQCLRNNSIQCPFCAVHTEVPFGDVSRVSVNYSILDMLSVTNTDDQRDKEVDTCENCNSAPASIVCESCSPIGFKFCTTCDNIEHNRGFKPARLHRRIPIQDYQFSIKCSKHLGTEAIYYSERLNQFACVQCKGEPDWPSKSSQYLQIVDAAEQLRKRATKLNHVCSSKMKDLHETSKKLDTTLHGLAMSESEVKISINSEFRKLINILEQRQQNLIRRVEEEYSSRKESLEKQKEAIVERSELLSNHHEQLKALLQNTNESFLRAYPLVTEGIMSYIYGEDKSLLRALAPGDIPCFFRTGLKDDLKNHGAVGGGPVPLNIICQRVPLQQSTLPQISWSLPQYSADVVQYEVEYEHIPDERPSSPNNSTNINVPFQPTVVPMAGNAQAHIMNDLIPGYRYLFRVRSRSIAGWGMWSQPITGRFEGLPVRIGFTGEKVSVLIPRAGEYRITAAGAKAADGEKFKGGRGAIISAVFTLQKYDRIEVAVGGMSHRGKEGHSGGAGGTFVLLSNSKETKVENLLIVAGGGGGTRGIEEGDEDGCDASLEPNATDGRGKEYGRGGREGLPGMDADLAWYQGPCWGYGGAGFMKSSKSAKCYAEGLDGGQCGGYGGGGGVGQMGGGGGGGYSGGGGGRGGGGGGSYITGSYNITHVDKKIGNMENGYVLIEHVNHSSSDPLVEMARKDRIGNYSESTPSSGSSSPYSVSPNNTQQLT